MTAAAKTDLLDLSRQLDADAAHAPGTPLLHKVRAGDTVSQIILDNYGVPPGSPLYRQAEAQLLYFNRNVTDVNRIRVGQTLRLLPLPAGGGGVCKRPDEEFHFDPWGQQPASQTRHFLEPADPNYVERIGIHIPVDPAEREAFWALAWLEQNYNWLAQPAGVGVSATGLLAGAGNAGLIREVDALYQQYKANGITKGQYDYRRTQLLKRLAKNLGPVEKLLLKGSARQVVRINRASGVPATARIDAAASRLSQLSSLATKGNVLLAGGGLYVGCRQIASAESRAEKNEVLVETVASTAVSGLLSVGIALTLATTPIGWGMALVLAGGTALASWGSGEVSGRAWTKWGQHIDLVDGMRIDSICK